MNEQPKPTRQDYCYFLSLPTRWQDIDIYAHVNNVMYYHYFDTIVGHFLVNHAGLNPTSSNEIGYIVKSHCNFLKGLKFPQTLDLAMRVNVLGNSSVEYGIAVFAQEDEHPAACGGFTHVFVDRSSERPTAIPDDIRAALQSILQS